MQLCFDATRFGFGLREAVEFAAAKGLPAVEFAFDAFDDVGPKPELSEQETSYLDDVATLANSQNICVACIKLNSLLDVEDEQSLTQFPNMIRKLSLVAQKVGCKQITFFLKPGPQVDFSEKVERCLSPILSELSTAGIKLVLSLSTARQNQGKTLRSWRPLEPHEWRNLVAGCPGLGLGFSAADCAWQSIDYLKVLPGLVSAIEHVEANDVEVNRPLLADSGLFGPLWWRYRRPGKGQIDWSQLIEALKLYDYQGRFSIHLDDEFIDNSDGTQSLEDSLDESIKFLAPLLK